MTLQDFIKDFSSQFDETDISTIGETTVYKDLEEWSSLIGLSVIALVRTKYGKSISAKDLRLCNTVNDLFNLIVSL